ncbi:gp89 [Streptococcus phage Sfi11]|uniref:Gp89 n=1 Tax=Streptococcus phage Sfi11 TaxID=2681625 RepID=Q9MCI1_9CAUD|nr:gp89 [Streptococcus phage Sfi11]AAF63062.1 gp89 [Streptococcus phage Sfi11]
MKSKVKDKLVGIYAPGHYDHTSVLEETQEFSKWFWDNHEDMEFISTKLGINTKKLNRILTLEQLPDDRLLKEMVDLCKKKNTHSIKVKT